MELMHQVVSNFWYLESWSSLLETELEAKQRNATFIIHILLYNNEIGQAPHTIGAII